MLVVNKRGSECIEGVNWQQQSECRRFDGCERGVGNSLYSIEQSHSKLAERESPFPG
jgi:hypothetical protein